MPIQRRERPGKGRHEAVLAPFASALAPLAGVCLGGDCALTLVRFPSQAWHDAPRYRQAARSSWRRGTTPCISLSRCAASLSVAAAILSQDARCCGRGCGREVGCVPGVLVRCALLRSLWRSGDGCAAYIAWPLAINMVADPVPLGVVGRGCDWGDSAVSFLGRLGPCVGMGRVSEGGGGSWRSDFDRVAPRVTVLVCVLRRHLAAG